MNENLNLVEILKDCPNGTKLYSSVFGEVELDHIDTSCSNYPIIIRLKGVEGHESLTSEGKMFVDYDGECVLFPSRENRDWSKFKPTCEFKDGDIVATKTGSWIGITTGGHAHSYMPTYCVLSHNREVKLYFGRKEKWRFNRLATEEEKQRLFDAIKERGYKWNAETKTLEKLVEHKFDPKTLMAFDRVLVRLTKDCIWNATFFSHYDKEVNWGCYPCVTTSCKSYDKCIPYNDETKHLLGTSDEAPEYYRYWED